MGRRMDEGPVGKQETVNVAVEVDGEAINNTCSYREVSGSGERMIISFC